MNDTTKNRIGYDWRGVLRSIWLGWLISIPTVAIVNIAILATPHLRGIGFRPELRYDLSAGACIVLCILGVLRYQRLSRRSKSSHARLAFEILIVAALVLFLMKQEGGTNLVLKGLPASLLLAGSIFVLAPWAYRNRPFSRTAVVVACIAGTLELIGIYSSVTSERIGSSARGELRDISQETWNVEHRFIELKDGSKVHYIDEGHGPVLLFLHGNPSYSFQWRGLIQSLRGSLRCIALDYPGFGFSSAPPSFGFTPAEESAAVEEFVNRLELQDITLVMQDWGGPIGLAFAERRPELVRRVILGNTWAWPTDTSSARGKFSVIAGGPIGEFLQTSFNGFTRMGIQNGIKSKLSVNTLSAYIGPSVSPQKRGAGAFYPGQINQARDFFETVESNLGRLRDKPALIFWGLRDVGFPRSDIERFEQTFPAHRTIEFPNADHFFFEDEGDKMIPEIQKFVSATQAFSKPIDINHQKN
jgi:pimeloyl-ACP methyl ester carboxylesterase